MNLYEEAVYESSGVGAAPKAFGNHSDLGRSPEYSLNTMDSSRGVLQNNLSSEGQTNDCITPMNSSAFGSCGRIFRATLLKVTKNPLT